MHRGRIQGEAGPNQGEAMTAIEFTLNGTPVASDVRDDETLLDVLRERLGLTSMKDGCAPEGSCGACTVMVDGKAVVSCAQKATHVRGKEVTTLDGLARTRRDEWAHAFVATGASQCGFCSPGIVMKAEALLNKNSSPTRDEVARGLAGNLCRCTGYVKIIDAVELAAAARRGEPLPALDASGRVGTRTPRYQGLELALGDKPYVNDMAEPGMLHGALRFSDHPRARVLSIDSSKAATSSNRPRLRSARPRFMMAATKLSLNSWRCYSLLPVLPVSPAASVDSR